MRKRAAKVNPLAQPDVIAGVGAPGSANINSGAIPASTREKYNPNWFAKPQIEGAGLAL